MVRSVGLPGYDRRIVLWLLVGLGERGAVHSIASSFHGPDRLIADHVTCPETFLCPALCELLRPRPPARQKVQWTGRAAARLVVLSGALQGSELLAHRQPRAGLPWAVTTTLGRPRRERRCCFMSAPWAAGCGEEACDGDRFDHWSRVASTLRQLP